MMSGSRHRRKDKDEDATAFARGGPFDYAGDYDEDQNKLHPVVEDEGLGRAPSFLQRLRGTASGAMLRIRSPYENLDRPDALAPPPRGASTDGGHAYAPRSSTVYLAAAAQREFLASEGGSAVAPDDERLLALRAAFVAANGPIPPDMDAVFAEMGDRGMCIMETWLAEHSPEALPLQPVSTLARTPTLGSEASLAHPPRRLPDGITASPGGLSGYRSVNLKSVPTLTRGNTLNSTNERMLMRLAGSSDKAYAPFAQMVREVLSSNLELAKQLRAQVEANSKGSADDPASAMENAFEGLEMSPSLAKALDELQHGCVYKGEDVQAFYLDNTFNGIKQAEADAQVPAVCKKRIRIDPLAAIVSLLFLGAFGFYVAWRVIFTLPGLGAYLPYGIAVLAIECLGAMSLVPYALTIMWYTVKEEPASTTTLHYHVRVLIPCYGEPLSVVGKTVTAALSAPVPFGCRKTLYLCDDGKDPDKRAFCKALKGSGHAVVYVSGRVRGKREINGKSCNINNVTALLFPAEENTKQGDNIPYNEVLAIFDADQECKPTFFMRTLPLMDSGRDVAMVLTPQTFYNGKPDADILNHLNVPFWHYTQVGYDALNIISCTGTNFLVRARAFMQVGQFPTYTLTEDFALGIRLKANSWKCRYVEEYLAVGEAPDDIRNCFQQRSRWAKGHFQLFFSRHCPLLEFSRLGLFARFMYTSVIVNYFSAFIATPVLLCVPMVTIWVGVFPLIINTQAALAITVYYVCTTLVVFYVRSASHIKSMWFALVANTILWFAYLKALIRATVGRLFGGLQFKATAKGAGASLAASGIQDTWIHLLSFVALVTTFVIACIQVARGPATNPIVISMAWMVYAMIPEFLLLYYWTLHNVFSGRVLKWLCFFARLLSFVVGVVGIVLIWPLLPKQYGDMSQPAALTTQFQGSQVSGQFGDALRSTFPAITWRADAQLGDAAIPVVNASLTGNYTDWLLKSGYFDDTLPLDISKQLSDFAQAAAQQQTLLTAISSSEQGILQALQQQLGTLATADPAGKEPTQLSNEATAVKGTVDSITKQLTTLQQQLTTASTSGTQLQAQVVAFNNTLVTTDTKRLPLDRVARDRLLRNVGLIDTSLTTQAAALANVSASITAAQSSLTSASTAAGDLAQQAGGVQSVGVVPNATTGNGGGNGRRRLQQTTPAKATPPPPPPPPPTPEQLQQIQQNNLQFQQQQDLLAQQAARRASDNQLRTSQNTVATSIRAAYDTLANTPSIAALASDLQTLSGQLASVSQTLGAQPTAPSKLLVKLEDVVSGSLWAPFRYTNATLLPQFDMRGGFITNMGAGNLKATSPIAFSTAMWALTLLEFPNPSDSVQLQGGPRVEPNQALLAAIRQGAEYLQKTFIANATTNNTQLGITSTVRNFTAIISRVGFPEKESLFTTRPEDAEMLGRTAFAISQEQGAADLAGLVAGGLAAAATVFRAQDPAFADACVQTAEQVFTFGTTRITPMVETDVDLAVLYNATSVLDDLAWGAAWLYRATNDSAWLAQFTKFAGLHLSLEADDAALYAFNVEQTFWGANSVLSNAPGISDTALPGLLNNTETFLKRWMCGGDAQIANSTRRGLALHPNFTTTGTTENAAFLAAIVGSNGAVKRSKQETFQCWALSQVRYVLGDGGRSLLGGFGKEPPQYAQDAGIACAGGTTPCDTFTTRFSPRDTFATLSTNVGGTGPPLVGGMITGPLDISDDVERERPLNSSRVGIENNVGIIGALAGVVKGDYGTDAFWQRCQQMAGAVRINPVCGTRWSL